jgi:hypothetical protein
VANAALACIAIGCLLGLRVPFHMVGTHRRIRIGDLLQFKGRLESEQNAHLADLAAEAQKLGLGY